MVVRSNGCFTCKRRRVKCDQGRPGCKRCAIHRTICPGYPFDTTNPINIIFYGSPTSSTDSSEISLPQQVDSAAQKRIQLIAAAAHGFGPPGDTPTVPLDLMDIASFNAVTVRQPALDAAIHALALVQLGTKAQNASLLSQAQREYGRSLRLLSSFIKSSRSRNFWDEETASAVIILKYCESFEPLYQANSSSIHEIGLRSFLLDRGPVPLKNTTESILFCQARVIILGGSFALRQKCFLEDDEWMEVSRTAPGRDSFFELTDIALRFPGLTQIADESLSRHNEQMRQDCRLQFESFIQELDNFAARSWPTNLETSTPSDSHTWSTESSNLGSPYIFSNWRSANMYCAWAFIRLYARLESKRLLHRGPQSDQARCQDIEADIERNIENMCRAIPSQIGIQQHSFGIICSLSMLAVVSTLLQNRGRIVEAAWCKGVLERLRSEGFR